MEPIVRLPLNVYTTSQLRIGALACRRWIKRNEAADGSVVALDHVPKITQVRGIETTTLDLCQRQTRRRVIRFRRQSRAAIDPTVAALPGVWGEAWKLRDRPGFELKRMVSREPTRTDKIGRDPHSADGRVL